MTGEGRGEGDGRTIEPDPEFLEYSRQAEGSQLDLAFDP